MQSPGGTPIEIRPNRKAQPRAYISGSRTRVIDVYAMAELQGMTPDEIVAALPHLTLAQVHAALAYYFANRKDIVHQLREEEELAQRFRAVTGPGPMESRIGGREAARDSLSS